MENFVIINTRNDNTFSIEAPIAKYVSLCECAAAAHQMAEEKREEYNALVAKAHSTPSNNNPLSCILGTTIGNMYLFTHVYVSENGCRTEVEEYILPIPKDIYDFLVSTKDEEFIRDCIQFGWIDLLNTTPSDIMAEYNEYRHPFC